MISQFSFGRIVIAGVVYTSDLKIIQDRVISEWRRKRAHQVEPDDLKDVLEFEPQILVLGKGDPGMMKADAALCAALEKNGIELIEEKTATAIQIFNRLLQAGKRVCAGLHLSC